METGLNTEMDTQLGGTQQRAGEGSGLSLDLGWVLQPEEFIVGSTWAWAGPDLGPSLS
jgi:hypothetical protein